MIENPTVIRSSLTGLNGAVSAHKVAGEAGVGRKPKTGSNAALEDATGVCADSTSVPQPCLLLTRHISPGIYDGAKLAR